MPFGVAFDDPVGVLPSMVGTTFLAFNRDPATQGLTDRVDRTSDLKRVHRWRTHITVNPDSRRVFGTARRAPYPPPALLAGLGDHHRRH